MDSSLLHDLSLIVPELFLTLSAMAILLAGVFQQGDGDRSRLISFLSTGVFAITIYLVIETLERSGTAFNDLFIEDGYASFVKVFILLGGAVAINLTRVDFVDVKAWRYEMAVLVMLACGGMMFMVSAHNFMTLYMGLELQSLSLYVLAAIRRDHSKSTEAGLKYFVLGALSSGFILYGMSLVYGYTGTLGFDPIAKTIGSDGALSVGAVVGLVFILAGVAFKISAVPFHMWTPDVYEGASTSIVAFFASAPKFAAIGLLVRLLYEPFSAYIVQWQQIILFMSVASMIVGAFGALHQTNIKRLFAYSSIGHIGYALMALTVGNLSSLSSLLFYMSIYFVMSIGAFALIVYVKHEDRSIEEISDLAGLSKTQPFMAFLMSVFMFSMAGIPPLAGFLGKLYVFYAVVEGGMYWLAVVGVLSSVVAAYYYLKVIKVMYFDESVEEATLSNSPASSLILLSSGLVLLTLIFDPSMLTQYTQMAAVSLFQP